MRPVSIHTGAWRYPGAQRDTNFNLQTLIRYAQSLERGCFDAFSMADHLALLNMPLEVLKRSHTVTSASAACSGDNAEQPAKARIAKANRNPPAAPAAEAPDQGRLELNRSAIPEGRNSAGCYKG
ncbi:hypothetical protein [Pseudomonas oryzihabitans]|uniref:hypothetical protein n=1 Tax=Pseudomonas oryzihabitans TaxID=47885 RepID=UPI002895E1EF|nr:hypothetical protein [Pseudomonas oryzihabitans]MDT3720377.1 hypothetical protein [Pseudomonas oryzihabitans]